MQTERRRPTTMLPTAYLETVVFKIHREHLAAVDDLARQHQHSRSAELRQAVGAWLGQLGPAGATR